MFRSIARATAPATRSFAASRVTVAASPSILRTGLRFSSHEAESYDDFNDRYQLFFEQAPDLFEVQRGLNNIFAYDLVPTVEVIEAAIQAARRYNDLPTAIRAIEGLRQKVEKVSQYDEYLKELKPLMEELGVPTKQDLYGQQHKGRWYQIFALGEGQPVNKE